MTVSESAEKPDLGYKFYPSKHPQSPGYPRVDIYIYETPTEHHFDPDKVIVNVIQPDHKLDTLLVRHPFSSLMEEPVFQVCAGIVTIEDHKGKKVELFTFGGELRVESFDTYTLCCLTSPVPIINMVGLSPAQQRLADQIICILAERRAARLQSSGSFDQKLTTTSPEMLYCSFILELDNRLKRLPSAGSNLLIEMRSLVRKEMEVLKKQGVWPAGRVPPISEIL